MFVGLLTATPEKLLPKLQKLARKAQKLGLDWNWRQIEGTTQIQRLVPWRWETTLNDEPVPTAWRIELVAAARIEVDALPHIGGCAFLARIEHTPAGNLVSAINGAEVPAQYWEAQPICEHCKQNRNRKDTFLLRQPDGSLIQVGRTCLGDFLRCPDPTTLVRDFQAVIDAGTPDESYGGWQWLVSTPDYIAAAVAAIDASGYRKTSEPESTAGQASWLTGLEPRDCATRELWRAQQPTAEQRERATKMMEWALSSTKGFDYEHNLKVACSLPSAHHRHRGLLASLPVAYARANELRVARERRHLADPPDPGYYAAEKARVTASVTLLRSIVLEGDWGSKVLYVFRTDAGHDLVWFCSGRALRSEDGARIEPGATLQLTGTVKRNELRQGRHQTVLTRCKVLLAAAA